MAIAVVCVIGVVFFLWRKERQNNAALLRGRSGDGLAGTARVHKLDGRYNGQSFGGELDGCSQVMHGQNAVGELPARNESINTFDSN